MDSSSSALFSARLFGIKIKISRFLAYFRGFRRFFPQDIVVLYIEIHIYGSRRIDGNDSVDLLIDSESHRFPIFIEKSGTVLDQVISLLIGVSDDSRISESISLIDSESHTFLS